MRAIVITSIANDQHTVLRSIAHECASRSIPFIVVGDRKSPEKFIIDGCDFYSMERQTSLPFELAKIAPEGHYSRKNLGYLIAMKQGVRQIQETDDDNIPLPAFWDESFDMTKGRSIDDGGWVNVYKYFSKQNIWPRGFPLEYVNHESRAMVKNVEYEAPIQQGLADDNPDVDAVYRLVSKLPLVFEKEEPLFLYRNTWCPFNSQNTRWYEKAFPLLYLPSYCSFRMTDIWRSFVAQRISWECGWAILFHNATVRQVRNDHNLLKDFEDEIPGYLNNARICDGLQKLVLHKGEEYIFDNMKVCYEYLINIGVVAEQELKLLKAWIDDCKSSKR